MDHHKAATNVIAQRVAARYAVQVASLDTEPVAPRELLDRRLRLVTVQLRRLLTQIRVRPAIPAHERAGDLVSIIQVAEGD